MAYWWPCIKNLLVTVYYNLNAEMSLNVNTMNVIE